MENIYSDVLRYEVVDYLPFRELYLIRNRYPRRFQELLQQELQTLEGSTETLITALKYQDPGLLEEVLSHLWKFNGDYTYDPPFITAEEAQEQGPHLVLFDIYSNLLHDGDVEGIAAILGTGGKTGSRDFDAWFNDHEKMDWSLEYGRPGEYEVEKQTLLSDEVIRVMDDDTLMKFIPYRPEYYSDHPYLILQRWYDIHGYIPQEVIQVLTRDSPDDSILPAAEELLEDLRTLPVYPSQTMFGDLLDRQ